MRAAFSSVAVAFLLAGAPVVSLCSDPESFLASVITFVPPADPRFPARSGSPAPSRPAPQPNSACGSRNQPGGQLPGGHHRLFGRTPTLTARLLP